MTARTPPLNVAQLNSRVEEVARGLGVPAARVRTMLCTLAVSQMLPEAAAVKGGMGVKLRLGERGTRATADLDVSTRRRGEEFESSFREGLAKGWGLVPATKGALRRDPGAPDRVAFTAVLTSQPLHHRAEDPRSDGPLLCPGARSRRSSAAVHSRARHAFPPRVLRAHLRLPSCSALAAGSVALDGRLGSGVRRCPEGDGGQR